MSNPDINLFRDEEFEEVKLTPEKIVCLGMEFESDDSRRTYFREELRKKLPELRQIEGFPIGEDDDIINLSDPPYYTACPNPWLNDFVAEWEKEKVELERQGKRSTESYKNVPYSFGISVGKNSAIYNAHTYHTKVPYQIIMRYILHYTQPGDIVLDSFAGTGMTGVAASACGNPDCETKNDIENDFSTNKLNHPVWGKRHAICGDLSPLCYHISSNYNYRPSLQILKKALDDIILNLKNRFNYLYEYSTARGKGHINYFVWSEIVACNQCGMELNVHDLTYDYESKTLYNELNCPYCGNKQKKNKTNQIKELIYDERNDKPINQIKYRSSLFNYSISKNGRYFSADNKEDILPEFCGFIPTYDFGSGYNIDQLTRTGCTQINQIYPLRTQYVLAYLYDLISKYDISIKKSLMFIFTSMLPKLTRLNRYMPQHGSRALVGPMANVLYLPPIYVENNPIDQFEYQAGKVLRAMEFCNSGPLIQISSATKNSLPDNSVDYIFTDPPFGANIMYSELNTVSESWLKLRTNNKEEAISNPNQKKGLHEYQNIMTECFKEYYRVLKPNKWMTVEFSNTSAAFWNSLQYSIQSAGFIISGVTDLNKERGGLYAMIGPTAVKQDLAISCYKPNTSISENLEKFGGNKTNAMDFIEELLYHLPVHLEKNNSTTAVIERSPKILYDRLISYYVQHGYAIPMDAQEFQKALRERFIERDGMFFTASQTVEYEAKKEKTNGVVPMALFISSEAEGIEWLKRELTEPQTYQEILPNWMKDMVAPKKGDILPELTVILEENFIKEEDGKWRKPDAEKAADLEILRGKKLMKEFNLYLEQASKPKAKRMKDTRLEVLRYGFKECYKQKNYQAIVTVGDHIQESLLQEDEVLLQYYDIASMRV